MNIKNGLIRPHHSKLSWAYKTFDMFLIFIGLVLSCWIYDVPYRDSYNLAVVVAITFMILVSVRSDLYRSWRVFGLLKEIAELFAIWGKVIILLIALAFIFKVSEDYSRLVIVTWFILAPSLMSISRLFVRNIAHKLRQKGWNSRVIAIVGANEQGLRFANSINDASWMGLDFIGFFDDRNISRIDSEGIFELAGDLDSVVSKARSGEIDIIYITMPLKAEDRTQELIHRLADTTVSLYYVPDFHALDILHGRWSTFGNSQVISVFENPYYGVDGWLKRLEDIILASCVLFVIALPLLIIAIGVKLSSPGPVIFKQHRYGINGQVIEVWKFRSMILHDVEEKVEQAQKCDIRITPFGLFLRRTSLDELPQFINVLQGEMSIVGPRPHAVAHNEMFRGEIHRYMMRHKVKPGITGWAQVNGWRGETDTLDKMQKRIEYDLEYIRNWSLLFDMKIFLLTLIKGFTHKNAY